MREIKFRGKRLDNGEWIYGDCCDCKKLDKTVQIRYWKNDYYVSYDVMPKTVGQKIGLKDKNGIEIYEGDLFKHPNGDKFVIKYDKNYLGFRAIYENGDSLNIGLQINNKGQAKLIGNIYDNKEL